MGTQPMTPLRELSIARLRQEMKDVYYPVS